MTTETTEDTTDVADLRDELAGIESARAIAQAERDAAAADLEGFHRQVRDGNDVDLPALGRAEQLNRAKAMRLQHLQSSHQELSAKFEAARTRQQRADELAELQQMADSLAAAQERVETVKEAARRALTEVRTAVEDAGQQWSALARRGDELLPFSPPDARSEGDHVTGACSRSGQGPYVRHGGINGVTSVTLGGQLYSRAGVGNYQDVTRQLV